MPLPSLNLSSFTFLVADPNPYFHNLLKGVLHAFGVRSVISTNSGGEALQITRSQAFDLIFSDCLLPELDGFDLVKRIRADGMNPNRYVPVITLTSHTQERHVARARDCGTSFVLAKPISPKQLYDRLAWVADDQRPYVMSEGYIGPDRRFKQDGRYMGPERRRIILDDSDESLELPSIPGPPQNSLAKV